MSDFNHRTKKAEEDMTEEELQQLKRDVQILSRSGAAADHPVSAACLESGYLKCLVTRVK